jgi:hypothetical protein
MTIVEERNGRIEIIRINKVYYEFADGEVFWANGKAGNTIIEYFEKKHGKMVRFYTKKVIHKKLDK